MKKSLLALSVLLFSPLLWASDIASSVHVMEPYARAVPPGQMNSGAFMTLMNHSMQPAALVSASSDVSEVVELHTHINDNGTMRMRQIDKIELAPHAETVLKPGGLHIMLIGLKQPLQPEQQVSLSLKFSDGSETVLSLPVKKVEMMKHGQMGHGDHHPMNH